MPQKVYIICFLVEIAMNDKNIEETFVPVSKWIAKTFFNEQHGRTLTKKVEEDLGIPTQKFHSMLIGGAVLGILIYFGSKH